MLRTNKASLAVFGLLLVGLLVAGCATSEGSGTVSSTATLTPESGRQVAATATPVSWTGSLQDFADSPLLVQGRNVLSVCVAAPDAVDTQVFKRILDEIRMDLAEHPNEPTEWLEGAQVAEGCPPPTALTGERIVKRGSGKVVEAASPHRVFIYVVPDDDFKVAFGDVAYGTAVEEMLCEGNQCAEVTTGVYVRELAPEVLKDGVIDALGLVALRLPSGFPVPEGDASDRDVSEEEEKEEG